MATQAGSRKPSKKLMVLSGAAIFAVYVAGYARTQAAADQWQSQVPTAPSPTASAAADGGTTASTAPATANAGGTATPPAATGGVFSSGANCATSTTPTTAVAPPLPRYGRGDGRNGYGDDGGRGRDRYRGGDDGGFAAPAATRTAGQAPCPPASGQASGQPAPAQAATSPAGQAQGASQTGGATAGQSQSSQSQQGQGAAASTATASPYKDGVYTGTGWSRHGSVSVALTIKSGKITSVVVTGCTTHYPCADVAPMTGEVLAAQSLQVDTVAGATDSSMSFLGAVQQALSAAQAAKG